MPGSTSHKWLKGCGIGCGAAVVLLTLIIVGGSLTMMRPFRQAIAIREELDAQYGDQGAYAPPADGAISPARITAFLAVRQALMALCPEFAATADEFGKLDELQEDTPKREILTTFFGLTKNVIGMGPQMGRFFGVRNQALLDAGMGRGEYTYIYLLAYREQLLSTSSSFDGSERAGYRPGRRLRGDLEQMLRNQLAALESQLADTNTPELAALHDTLTGEIERLTRDPQAWPWQNGPPVAVVASLAPYRSQLDSLFCEYTLTLEFTQNRARGLSIQGN